MEILRPINRKLGFKILRIGRGFNNSLLVFYISRINSSCAVRLGFSIFALDLFNYFDYLVTYTIMIVQSKYNIVLSGWRYYAYATTSPCGKHYIP